jgi:hypothetical protein
LGVREAQLSQISVSRVKLLIRCSLDKVGWRRIKVGEVTWVESWAAANMTSRHPFENQCHVMLLLVLWFLVVHLVAWGDEIKSGGGGSSFSGVGRNGVTMRHPCEG